MDQKKIFKAFESLQHKETFDLINKIKKNSKGTKILFFSFKKNIGQRLLRIKF